MLFMYVLNLNLINLLYDHLYMLLQLLSLKGTRYEML